MSEIIENSNEQLDLNEILQVRRNKLSELQETGNDPFHFVIYSVTDRTNQILSDFEGYEGKNVSLAGRLMSKRGMGKSSFCDLQDRDGRIQLYVRINDIGEDNYENFKKLDIGDIIGVTGRVFKTRMGEVSIHAEAYTLLS